MRIGNKLDSDRCALAFTAGHSLDQRAPDLGILALVKPQLLDDLIDPIDLLFMCALELEFGTEFEALTHGHSLEENIILLHVGRESREIASHLFFGDAVDQNLAILVQRLTDLPPRQKVKQSGLSST